MDERELIAGLGRLGRVQAPPGFAAGVLAGAGLADSWAVVDTVVGPISVAHGRAGVSGVMRTTDPEEFETWFAHAVGRPLHRAATLPDRLATAVAEEIAGVRRHTLRFDLRGRTEFERAVLHVTLRIPRGEIRPYAWVAREIGHPAAVRAVGSALGRNPVPYLIPCHRVVRSDGHIGEYGGGGPEAKRRVLQLEGVPTDQLESDARSGRRLVGSSTTGIFCYPTCHNARRVTARRRLTFGSGDAARRAGLRPCRVCRPV
jgi:methylated-DNA-[protein]-cysteine S-methyltransferase